MKVGTVIGFAAVNALFDEVEHAGQAKKRVDVVAAETVAFEIHGGESGGEHRIVVAGG
ncbi:MAG: hypothetical protein R3C68_06770 [Myxococcota bacterium]